MQILCAESCSTKAGRLVPRPLFNDPPPLLARASLWGCRGALRCRKPSLLACCVPGAVGEHWVADDAGAGAFGRLRDLRPVQLADRQFLGVAGVCDLSSPKGGRLLVRLARFGHGGGLRGRCAGDWGSFLPLRGKGVWVHDRPQLERVLGVFNPVSLFSVALHAQQDGVGALVVAERGLGPFRALLFSVVGVCGGWVRGRMRAVGRWCNLESGNVCGQLRVVLMQGDNLCCL